MHKGCQGIACLCNSQNQLLFADIPWDYSVQSIDFSILPLSKMLVAFSAMHTMHDDCQQAGSQDFFGALS